MEVEAIASLLERQFCLGKESFQHWKQNDFWQTMEASVFKHCASFIILGLERREPDKSWTKFRSVHWTGESLRNSVGARFVHWKGESLQEFEWKDRVSIGQHI